MGWTAEKSQIAEGRMTRGREKMLYLHHRKCMFPLVVSEQTVDVSKEKNQLSSLAGSCVIIREWENQSYKKCSALFHRFLLPAALTPGVNQQLWSGGWESKDGDEGQEREQIRAAFFSFLSSEAPRSRKGMCFNLKSCSNSWLLHGTTNI